MKKVVIMKPTIIKKGAMMKLIKRETTKRETTKRTVIGIFTALLLSATVFPLSAQANDYTNSIGMKFKNIAAGSFYMGSCTPLTKKEKFLNKSVSCPVGKNDPKAGSDESPKHKVRISKAFQLGAYEVTVGQFKKFIATAGRDDLVSDDFINANSHGDGAAVSHVSWDDAQAFIKWLNNKEGGNRYRLPTEAEWEYAARAGTTTVYSWGNNASQASGYAWYDENAYDRGEKYAHRVGGKKANPWGLYDMHGNVWEWVQDWYGVNYYRNSPASDPTGASSGRYRVSRGGSWNNFAWLLRSAYRNYYSPDDRLDFLGFRLVRKP